jgi:hypothetical protein
MKKMKAKGYSRGGAPMGMKKPGNEIVRPGKNSPKLSSAQENLLRQAQSYAKETGQNPAEVKRLTGMYGDLNAAKEAEMSAAKGVKKARRQAGARGTGPRRMNMGGVAMAPPGTTAQRLPPSGGPKAIDTAKLGALPPSGGPKAIDTAKLGALPPSGGPKAIDTAKLGALPPSGGPKAIDTGKLGALPPSRSTRPTKATAMRGAAARRSGGSTPRGMNMGGAVMKTKGYAKGGAAMKTKGSAKGGARKPSSKQERFVRTQIVAYLQSNIHHFKCWVRKEYTHNHEKYHGEFIHAMAIAVTTMPTRCLSFQVIFTGAETYDYDDEQNAHGGAMWARMPITALVADTPLDDWPEAMPVWACSTLGLQFL